MKTLVIVATVRANETDDKNDNDDDDDDENDNDDDDDDEETRDSLVPQRAQSYKARRRRNCARSKVAKKCGEADGKGDKNHSLGFSI